MHVIVRCGGWESIFWMWPNTIFQMSANIDAYCIISLARECLSPRIPQCAEADMTTTSEYCYEHCALSPLALQLGMTSSHVSCYMYLGESWWWCVGALREGRNCGSLCAPCGGAEWWLVSRSLGGTDHLPPHNITLNLSAVSWAASLPPILYHGPVNNIL